MKYTIIIIMILAVGLVSAGIYHEVKIKDINEISKKLVCDKLKINESHCLEPIKLKDTGISMEQVNISDREVIKVWAN